MVGDKEKIETLWKIVERDQTTEVTSKPVPNSTVVKLCKCSDNKLVNLKDKAVLNSFLRCY